MKVITDGRTLNSLQKKVNFTYDAIHKYVIIRAGLFKQDKIEQGLKPLGYSLKYFDGCFYPFIVKN